jgi:hypothetical protein
MVEHRQSRRDVLKGAGIAGVMGLSGCLGTSGTDPPSGRRVTDLSVSGPDSDLVSIAATVARSRVTAEGTAQFTVTVAGQREESATLVFGSHVPFSAPQYSTPPGLLLLPASENVERRTERTWIPREGYQMSDREIVVEDLADGETVTGKWAMWGDPEHVSYVEPGTYEFETSVRVDSSDDPIPWTLTVTVGDGSPGE